MQQARNKVVVDSSAILAFWNDEPGWDVVEPFQGRCLISSVNAAEVISKLIQNGANATQAKAAVCEFVAAIVPYDIEQAYDTGKLITEGRRFGLSLGDRACLGLGSLQKLPVLTADTIWAEVDLPVEVQLIR